MPTAVSNLGEPVLYTCYLRHTTPFDLQRPVTAAFIRSIVFVIDGLDTQKLLTYKFHIRNPAGFIGKFV
jgi:hypothetical protein